MRTRFYVKRTRTKQSKTLTGRTGQLGYVGWTGAIVGIERAGREAAAWKNTGEWDVQVLPSTPDVRRQVREWEANRN